MNNDLISREALKKCARVVFDKDLGRLRVVDVSDIDNAPTVEPCYQTTSCLDCKNYDKETHNCPRYCEVIKEAIKSRPKGEWIRKVDEVGFVSHICSKCGAEIEVEDCSDDKFCFNCGADMRKGGAE